MDVDSDEEQSPYDKCSLLGSGPYYAQHPADLQERAKLGQMDAACRRAGSTRHVVAISSKGTR